MPGRINEQDVQTLRERADLAAVIGAHTSLAPAGSGRLKGLCPFHSERTPSFHVDLGRRLWYCFGCSLGGDVYDFLRRAEALSFPEAIERLARLEGYELRYEELSPGQRRALGRRTRLVEAVAAAAEWFRGQLASSDAAAARDYLLSRGVGEAEAARFALGWAPDSWDALSRHLLGAGFDLAELIGAGLASQGRQGPLDRFRGRVIFPISEGGGRDVIAFGGRIVPGLELRTGPREGEPPKYLNSAESELYRKSGVLYGLGWARAEIQRRQAALVVEGYMDVIGLALAGAPHAVATCGTSLTAEHLRSLERFAPKVVLALDADAAGAAAVERARALAEEVGVREVGVLPLPPGTDPADLARSGPEAVEAALRGVVTAVEFQIAHLLGTADTTTPEAAVAAYRRTFPLLASIGDRVLRYSYVRDVVAPAVRVNADRIERELDEAVAAAGPQGRTGPPPTAPPPAPGDLVRPRDPQVAMERDVLQVALQRHELLGDAWAEVTETDFRAPASRLLYRAIASAAPGDLDAVLAAMPDDDTRSRVRALTLGDLPVTPSAAWVRKLLQRLRAAALARESAEVAEALGQLNPDTDASTHRELLQRRMELERRRRDLVERSA